MAQFMDIRKMKSFKLNSCESKEGAPKVEYRAPLSFETIIHQTTVQKGRLFYG